MPRGNKKAIAKTNVDKRQDKIIRKIVKEYAPEMKTTYVTFPGAGGNALANQTNSPTTIQIVPVGQGDGINQRQGDTIRIKKVVINVIAGIYSGTSAFNWLRFVLVRERGYQGTPLSYQQILDGTSVTDTRDDNMLANYDINYVNMYGSKSKAVDVLMDKKLYFGKLDSTTYASFADGIKHRFSFSKTWKSGLQVKFDGASGGDVRANNLEIYIFGGCDTTAASNPSFTGRAQIYYTDA